MSFIPGGLFQMGDTFADEHADERPVHWVETDAFFMDSHEVPVGQWDTVYHWATNHDFKRYPGMIEHVQPYELLVDTEHRLSQLRQRCYTYLGSASLYSNTLTSVQERVKRNGRGITCLEVLDEELRRALVKEQNEMPTEEPGSLLQPAHRDE
ncbi:SUMF1/EgtB/PvdO family nonheme iron enzyme [Verrucomicrobiota bacterium]